MLTKINKIVLQGFKSFNRKVSIPFTSGFNVITGPNASGKCLEYSSLVQLADGSIRPIGEIVETILKKVKEVKKLEDGIYTKENPDGMEVLSLNPFTLKLEKKKVAAFIKRRAPKKLLKIKTRSGREITVTEYHPFFTFDGICIKSVKAEELRKGLKIAVPRKLPIETQNSSIKFLDSFEVNDKIYVPYSERIWLSLEEMKRKIFKSWKKFCEEISIPYNVIQGLGERQAIENKIHSTYLEYSTAIKQLAFDVGTLLLRLGIFPMIRRKIIDVGNKNLKKVARTIQFKSKKKKKALAEVHKWNSKTKNVDLIPNVSKLVKLAVKEAKISVKKIRKICPKLQAYYENRCEASRNGLLEVVNTIRKFGKVNVKVNRVLNFLETLARSDIFWDEIVYIREVKPKREWVYDLSIPITHNFIANNIIIHNSNILDSICFVLGKISAKSLRAGKLQELIFHGSEKKKPAKQASVTIYFDNSNKIFPFEEDEIVITRKINPKGICTYKLNGKTVTREKILQVLSAARIYPDGHNIVFQGDVARIIEMSPLERRYIIDEISGIAEYNARKEKALRDLEFVEQKLREAELLISERYNIFRKLEKERNDALRYKELNVRLKILRASFARKKLQLLEEKLDKILAKISRKEELLRKINKRLREVEEEFDKKNEEMRNIARKLIEFSKLMKDEREITKLRTEILIKKSQVDAMEKEIERINSFIERLQFLEDKKIELIGRMPRAVKEVLERKFKGVHGTILSLIKVPEELKIPIQIAAGNHLYSIVVENEDVAKNCIEFLRREKIGRATFLPLNKLKPFIFDDYSILNKEGVIGVASKLIKYDIKFMRAIEFVFGNTLIVKDLDAAKRIGIGRVRMVTLDGDLIERSGIMSGGYYVSPLILRSSVERELSSYLERRKRLKERISTLQIQIAELERRLSSLKGREEEREILDLEKVKIISQRKLEELREKRRRLTERKISIQSTLNDLAIEKTRIESEIKNVRSEVEQYGEIEYFDGNLSEIAGMIRKIEDEIRKLEPVNFKAIEEYEVFKKEFDKYKERYDKILKEKEVVLKMIEKIDEKRKEVFFSCLEKLSSYFNSIFNSITQGIAELELEDPNDLESGLIIKATPKGKSLLNIDAMSGGEKTITALSFLFAIQKFKPAPFYVLDEVDAMLDRENTKKIAEMIKKFSKNSQFIVITHNDQTVKYGDVVYGVTMIDGESKIVGLKLPRE